MRPPVAVVMPFAGTPAEARRAIDGLAALAVGAGDTLVLADNSGTASGEAPGPVRIVSAAGERSPAHARNAGAAATAGDWILFLDADTRPEPDLLDAFFAEPVADDAGAVAGEIVALPSGRTLAARYGAARNFLGSSTHLAHPYRPRVSAANLLVRRAAFDAVGGFREGIRAAEDTDFCWRLQDAGWTLALRPAARAGHAYRGSLRALRRQWRGYAAGRAWLGRTWPGFHPEPALKRALRRAGLGRLPGVGRRAPAQGPAGARLPNARVNPGAAPRSARERLEFAFVDILLGLEELRGLRQSNDAR
jgi:glycosyltransferase involved in cell wall biosynthesis